MLETSVRVDIYDRWRNINLTIDRKDWPTYAEKTLEEICQEATNEKIEEAIDFLKKEGKWKEQKKKK